jgi:hypothetical protein
MVRRHMEVEGTNLGKVRGIDRAIVTCGYISFNSSAFTENNATLVELLSMICVHVQVARTTR